METFTPLNSLAGGVLIGLACALLLLFNGRIAGIAGVLGGLLSRDQSGGTWRWAFLLGLVSTGFLLARLAPAAMDLSGLPQVPILVGAGLLVGVGTRVGGGCTSGHGVCGISRFSVRSIVATLIFMLTAMLTVLIARHWLGGAP